MRMCLSFSRHQDRVDKLVARFGYFDCQIDHELSNLIAALIWAVANQRLKVFVATYLFDETRWNKAKQLGWQIHLRKTFVRKALFPKTITYSWIVGYCPSQECLQEVINTGWNLSGNESFIMILSYDTANILPKIGETYEDDLGTLEFNELKWIDFCPFVFSRDHDGLTLRLYTRDLDEDELRQKVEFWLNSLGIDFSISIEPL